MNEIKEAELDGMLRDDRKPIRKIVDNVKDKVVTPVVGAGAMAVGAIANIKPKVDLKSIGDGY
jgi:hypothetical protein